jgi:hypothetical protein
MLLRCIHAEPSAPSLHRAACSVSPCQKGCGCGCDVCRWALTYGPEKKGFNCGAGKDCSGLPFPVRQGPIDGADVVSQVRLEVGVGDETEFRCAGRGGLIWTLRERQANAREWIVGTMEVEF